MKTQTSPKNSDNQKLNLLQILMMLICVAMMLASCTRGEVCRGLSHHANSQGNEKYIEVCKEGKTVDVLK